MTSANPFAFNPPPPPPPSLQHQRYPHQSSSPSPGDGPQVADIDIEDVTENGTETEISMNVAEVHSRDDDRGAQDQNNVFGLPPSASRSDVHAPGAEQERPSTAVSTSSNNRHTITQPSTPIKPMSAPQTPSTHKGSPWGAFKPLTIGYGSGGLAGDAVGVQRINMGARQPLLKRRVPQQQQGSSPPISQNNSTASIRSAPPVVPATSTPIISGTVGSADDANKKKSIVIAGPEKHEVIKRKIGNADNQRGQTKKVKGNDGNTDGEETEVDEEYDFDPQAQVEIFDHKTHLEAKWDQIHAGLEAVLQTFAKETLDNAFDTIYAVSQMFHKMDTEARAKLIEGVEGIKDQERLHVVGRSSSLERPTAFYGLSSRGEGRIDVHESEEHEERVILIHGCVVISLGSAKDTFDHIAKETQRFAEMLQKTCGGGWASDLLPAAAGGDGYSTEGVKNESGRDGSERVHTQGTVVAYGGHGTALQNEAGHRNGVADGHR
ncbi:hypothetical protein I316_02799 [Kwoniella heveanensis BCC8398]|uniref:Uncharacterized protein n=1 Tax=Kwoniella heveanensis BCC8398 TaxID=1296120 RepID=A0A1B9GW46_9TREE|nr:hypothetical protein I316_02799 [Kwoniella heveanensis BCC8398]